MFATGIFFVVITFVAATKTQTNLALGKPAYGSGQWQNWTIPDNTYGCTHTEDNLTTPTLWWTVDLQGFYHTSSVTITNRGNCCGDRLNDFKVMVGNHFSAMTTKISEISRWNQCAHVPGQLGDGETRNIQCSEVYSGRFVSIYLDHDGILTLCEVQVFGYQYDHSRVFEKKKENTKVTGGGILGKHQVKAETECVLLCVLHYTCTRFSYHSDLLSNNCLLGPATSSEETGDGWKTFFI